jgi:hypothetical protein
MVRSARAAALGASWLLAVGALGCEGPTEIVVVVDTDLAPGELSSLAVEITGPDGEPRRSVLPLDGDAALPATVGMVRGEGAAGPYLVRAVGLLDQAEVVDRTARVFFVPGRVVVLPLHLLRRCVGAVDSCGPDSTCGEDGCRPVDVSAEELLDWAGSPPGLDAGPADADPDVEADVDAGACDGGATWCEGDVLSRCVGGRRDDEVCPFGCDAAQERCSRIVPSNVDRELLSIATTAARVRTLTRLDTDLCDPQTFVPAVAAETVDVAGGPGLCVMVMASLDVEAGATLDVTGSRALVVVAAGDVVVDGTVSVTAQGSAAGPGGAAGGGPGEPGVTAAGGGGGAEGGTRQSGGGGGGFGGGGGAGGSAEGAPGGGGGASRGTATLVPLLGGGGGGGGASQAGAGTGGAGGGGGGALQISTSGTIVIGPTGVVTAGGGGGGGGGTEAGGGGGGAGGGVLLEAATIDVTGVVAANGGGGGASNGGQPGGAGAPGATAAPGGPDPGGNAERGGDGGADDAPDGETAPDELYNCGGGGGGVGRIRLNTRSGSAGIAGTVSPRSPTLFTLGVAQTW